MNKVLIRDHSCYLSFLKTTQNPNFVIHQIEIKQCSTLQCLSFAVICAIPQVQDKVIKGQVTGFCVSEN